MKVREFWYYYRNSFILADLRENEKIFGKISSQFEVQLDKDVQIVRRNRVYKEESSQDLVVKMKNYADLGCEKN